ncbi:MAG: PhzF family phenazine biosynthesis protein [Planctomycetota bacterium]
MPSDLPVTVVDAFADAPFTGNPAAVVVTDTPLDDWLMQDIAAQMNLSETAFVVPRGGDAFDLRWFTPAVEVKLCGHATLASAFVLDRPGRTTFHTLSGPLHAQRSGDRITLDFPPRSVVPDAGPTFGIEGQRFRADEDLLVLTDDVDTAEPDLAAIRSAGVRGLIVTGPGRAGFDVFSRFFAPGAGIDEDPVTGSAHCALATFWADRLGKTELRCRQRSRRGGTVEVCLADDRVHLTGTARTALTGQLRLP